MNRSNVFVTLTIMFCTSLIVSNIIAGKLWAAPFGVTLTAGSILFPIVYIIGDVVPELYGLKVARQVIWFGFTTNLFAVLFFLACLALPYPSFWQNQNSFEVVLGFTPRLLGASFCGYLVGTNANAWTLVVIKKLTGGRWLWIRTIGSTIVGESLDSLLFMVIAFVGIIQPVTLVQMILAQAAFKTLYEAAATPMTYAVVGAVKRIEGYVI